MPAPEPGPLTDLRLLRLAWLLPLAAFVVLMFSFEGIPEALEPAIPPAEVDGERATETAREIVARGGERAPGSSGNAAVADFVAQRFSKIAAGEVTEQAFDGDGGALRNVILTLPGESEHTIVLVAPRDSARAEGAVSSAAATAVLLELGALLGTSEHQKQIVLVSTDGHSEGAAGAREYAREGTDPELVDGVIAIGPPAAANRSEEPLVRSSAGRSSAPMQLVNTLVLAITEQTGAAPPLEGTFTELARLALPSGLGEQAVLIDEGLAAVSVSSTGERLPPEEEDGTADLDPEAIADFGRAALAGALALDAAEDAPERGPDAFVRFAGNVVPGWALSLLALALLVPGAVAAIDALARGARRRAGIVPALRWALSLPVPLVGGLLALHLLALIGLVPDPDFPFDPERYGFDAAALLAIVVVAVPVALGYVATGIWRPPPLPRQVLAPALGSLAVAAVALAWLLNPYLALLLVPVAHAWLVPAGERAGPGGIVATALLALVPIALALWVISANLDLGLEAPWQLLLFVTSGQIGLFTSLCLCAAAAALAGLVLAARRRSAGSRA